MDYTMIILLITLVSITFYLAYSPDNCITRLFNKVCCDADDPDGLLKVEAIKIPTPTPITPKKKRVSKRRKKATPIVTKPKKKKYTRKKIKKAGQ